MAPNGVAGGEGGGAGGAGGGAGAGAALTMEAVIAEVDKRIGTKLTTQFDTFKKEGLGPAIQEHLAPINTTLTGITENLAKLVPAAGGNGNGGGQGGDKNIPPETNVLLKQLQETVKTQGANIESLRKQKEEADQRAEKSERQSIIRSALGNLNFVSDVAAATAFTIVEPHIVRTENGSLVGGINGDNFPVDAFVKDYLVKDHPYLMRSSGVSGSGAAGGGNGGSRIGTKADLNDIKIGMKAESRDAVVASIQHALANQ